MYQSRQGDARLALPASTGPQHRTMTRQAKASNEEEDEDILGLGDVPYMGDDLLDLGGMDQLALVRYSTYFPHTYKTFV